jgi:mono/diheme cytochrome c family protein
MRCRFFLRPTLWLIPFFIGPTMLVLHGQTPKELNESGTAKRSPTKSGAVGRTVFKMRCTKCHGSQGKGDEMRDVLPEIPDFTNAHWQKRRTVAELTVSILDGKGKKMPAFADSLTKEEARELAVFVGTLSKAEPADALAPETDELQRRFYELKREFERLRKQFDELDSRMKKRPNSE